MNPARSLAPAVVAWRLEHLWVYLTAPVLGAGLAVAVCVVVHGPGCCVAAVEGGGRMPARRKVIFVCVENSNRSQMAEAFARIHGGDTVEAFSAGSRPSGRVNPKAVEAMKEVGYDLIAHQSKGLDEFNGKEFDAAVTMGCGDECPLVIARVRVDWQIPDPKDLPPHQFNEVRDLIERKVKELLATL
jgi:protein-tyrosine-phosphatase